MKSALGVAAGLAAAVLAVCPARATGTSVRVRPSGADIALAGGVLQLRMPRNNVLHVHFLPHGQASPPALVMARKAPSVSSPDIVVRLSGPDVVLRRGSLRAAFDRHTTTLEMFAGTDRKPLITTTALANLAREELTLSFARGSALYGVHGFNATQSAAAGLLRTGTQLATAGEQGDAGAPFVWSTAGFGMLIDSQKTLFDLSDGALRVVKQTRPDFDFYLIAGAPKPIFAAVADLTGHAPLFPKWSFGFINSQWGIDQGQLLRIVRRYRAMHIPLDAFSLDFDWKAWGEDNYGEFRWNQKNFPDAPSGKLDRELTALGVHLIGIMKPRIHVNTVEGRYATAHHLWIPGEQASLDYFSHLPVKTLDFDNPATRNWFFNPVLKHSFETGIVGWWNDEADDTGDDKQFFNMERALYDGQRAFTNQRVWSLNRNFWLGAQRYAYGLWSGDIDSGFTSMAAQRQRMLSAIDVGEMWWGMDGGGFHHSPSSENYARWIEFDAFAPICRVHGSQWQLRQPWVFGDTARRAATAALDLRYRLLPYIYSYAWQDHVTGVGLVRPLIFGWPHDLAVRNDYSAWMFGDWLLASPVVGRHQSEKHLYLPPGLWTDYFSGKVYQGGQLIALPVDSKTWSDIPLFIRQGAIIPTQPLMDYVGERPVTTITVDVFPSTHATHFDYYDDDGETYAYEHGDYYLQRLSVQAATDSIHLAIDAPQGSYRPALRDYLLEVHGTAAGLVQIDGAPSLHVANSAVLMQCTRTCWTTGHDRFGAVTDIKVPAGRTTQLRLSGKGGA